MSYYYTRDHLGSTREMLNSSGTIVARYSYDPYGRTTLVSGSNIATFQYTGDYQHQASGLNLTWYRAYDTNTGRWLSRDPAEEDGGNNLYGYVGDDPEDFYDPDGLRAYVPPVSPGVRVLPYIARAGPWAIAAALAIYDIDEGYQIYEMNQATEAQKEKNDALQKCLPPATLEECIERCGKDPSKWEKKGTWDQIKAWRDCIVACMKKFAPTDPRYTPPKGGPKKAKKGWEDDQGSDWQPTNHNGNEAPHYDVQQPNGKYRRIFFP